MKILRHAVVLGLGLALTANAACSKSKSEESYTTVAGDVQGLAKESLLVLKFHHDN